MRLFFKRQLMFVVFMLLECLAIRKRLIFMMMILLTMCTKSFCSTTFTVDGIKYEVCSDNVRVDVKPQTGGYSGDIVIPELVTYNGKKYVVTYLSNNPFANCKNLKSLTLPSTITYFGESDIRGCDSLERINISSPVDWENWSLTSLPESATVYLDGKPFVGDVTFNSNIDGGCFEGYNHFTSVTIEDGCSKIGVSAFAGCTNLKSVSFNTYCGIDYTSFPALDYLHIGKKGINPAACGTAVVKPNRIKFLYCEGKGATYYWGGDKSAFICDTVVSKGYFENNAYINNYVPGRSFDYLKVGVFTPEEKSFKSSSGNGKMIYLCNTLNMSNYNRVCLTNYYFWNKDSLCLPLSTEIVDSLKSAKNVIDFTSFPTVNKFTYSGKSPLETITFVNNTGVIDVKMDSTKFGVNVGEYSGIPFVASLKEWSCDLTWPYEYTIEKAPLTIMGNSITREYGQPNPELSCTYIGLVNGETQDVLNTPVRLVTTATEDSPVGAYPIIPSNATSYNYDITFERGTLNIIPASQSITWEQELVEAKVGDIIELSATSSSGLNVSFSSSNPAVIDIYSSNGKWYAECMAVGKARITAAQSGNNNYNAADNIVKHLSVTDIDTSISNIDAEGNAHKQIYNLEGRKLTTMKQGINIVNGKKVLVK